MDIASVWIRSHDFHVAQCELGAERMSGIKIDLSKTVGTSAEGHKTGSEKGGVCKGVIATKKSTGK